MPNKLKHHDDKNLFHFGRWPPLAFLDKDGAVKTTTKDPKDIIQPNYVYKDKFILFEGMYSQ